ncbi:MAG: hypothetical protein ACLTYN_04420 [Dysosmobacter welbionis]
MGFAIPINDVISMIQDIMTNGYVSNKAYLGATIGTLTSGMAQQYRYDISQGAFVYSVEDGSPAAAAACSWATLSPPSTARRSPPWRT